MSVVEVRGVSKYYPLGALRLARRRDRAGGGDERFDPVRGLAALSDVSFSVEAGEATALVGSNGAGKTTMLRVLAGVTRPTTGSAKVRGRISALLSLKAGMNPRLSGRENLLLYGALMGFGRKAVEARIPEIVEFSGLGRFVDMPMASYSPGMGTRLAFAAAMHLDANVLLIDEILAVGDPAFQAQALTRMRQHFEAGLTVVFASHNLQAVRTLCSQVVWFEGGRVRMAGPTSEVLPIYQRSCGEGAVETAAAPPPAAGPREVERLELTNALGRARRRFRRGETICVDHRWSSLEAAPGSVLRLVLRDPVRATLVWRSESDASRWAAGLPESGRVTCAIEGLELPARQYTLELGLVGPGEERGSPLARSRLSVYDPDEAAADPQPAAGPALEIVADP